MQGKTLPQNSLIIRFRKPSNLGTVRNSSWYTVIFRHPTLDCDKGLKVRIDQQNDTPPKVNECPLTKMDARKTKTSLSFWNGPFFRNMWVFEKKQNNHFEGVSPTKKLVFFQCHVAISVFMGALHQSSLIATCYFGFPGSYIFSRPAIMKKLSWTVTYLYQGLPNNISRVLTFGNGWILRGTKYKAELQHRSHEEKPLTSIILVG